MTSNDRSTLAVLPVKFFFNIKGHHPLNLIKIGFSVERSFKLALMDQIGARRKKLVAGGALLYDTVFRYTGKRATTSLIEIGDRYNDIPYISSLLQICSGQ